MTADERDKAALAAARRMAEACEASRRYGRSTGFVDIEEALWNIANGNASFADICDDNIYIHETLAGMKLIPASVSRAMKSDRAMERWNEVCARLDWAAAEILVERAEKFWRERA